MNPSRFAVLVALATFLASTTALAAGSGKVESSPDLEIAQYNKGVGLMLRKKFSKAEKWFRKSLATKEDFAEAHNNLGYCLRKQGPDEYEEALTHYNRAIELAPKLPEPYMYRGVLYVQMGDEELAKKDRDTLETLSPGLAKELAYVIENKREKKPEQFFGVSREFD